MAVHHSTEALIHATTRSRTGEWLMRFGFIAKGTLYCLIGVMALMMALGRGGETTDKRGAIEQIARQPFGEILLGFIIAGLAGHALWRFYQAISDPERKGSGLKGRAVRGLYFCIGAAYTLLAIYALRILMNDASGGGNEGVRWTAKLMSFPFGIWLVGLAGFAVIGAGLRQFFKGHREKFRRHLALNHMSRKAQRALLRAGRWGYYARGVVFGLIGIGLITAATQADPSEARGIEGALDMLASQSYGQILLGVVAVGLTMYGLFTLVQARYRRLG